jgi:hypothetical protein
VVSPKPEGRSRTTNGAQLLIGIDGRSAQARRFRDILRGYQREFESASDDELRSVAMLALRLEEMQAQLVRGERVDDVVMARMARVHHEIIIALRGSGLPDLSAVLCPNDDEEGDFA